MKKHSRLEYIDQRRAGNVVTLYTSEIEKTLSLLKREPGKLRQRRELILTAAYTAIGLEQYGLAAPLDVCQQALAKAVTSCLKMFRLRGTQNAFPVLDLSVNMTPRKDAPSRAQLRARYKAGTKDYSQTNSKDGYWYTCLGFGIGEEQIARELASLIWDPPDADYIGSQSLICTPNQQALAYAVRHYIEGNHEAAASTVSRVRARPGDYVGHQAHLLASLIQRDADAFLQRLGELLDRHAAISRRESWDSHLYICIPALGISALAVSAQMVEASSLPISVYLPKALFLQPQHPK